MTDRAIGAGIDGATTGLARLLRTLVILYWIVGTLDVTAAMFWADRLPAELQAWLDSSAGEAGTGEWLLRGWMLILLAGLIAGSLGVLRLAPWGRWLFAAVNVAMFASYPLLDAMVYTWFGGLFADLSLALTGAILALAFLPSGVPGYRAQRQRAAGAGTERTGPAE